MKYPEECKPKVYEAMGYTQYGLKALTKDRKSLISRISYSERMDAGVPEEATPVTYNWGYNEDKSGIGFFFTGPDRHNLFSLRESIADKVFLFVLKYPINWPGVSGVCVAEKAIMLPLNTRQHRVVFSELLRLVDLFNKEVRISLNLKRFINRVLTPPQLRLAQHVL